MAVKPSGKTGGAGRLLPNAVSMDPDTFVSGGLPGDFDGVVKEARTCVWNYDNGNGPKLDDQGNVVFGLFVRLTIERADDDDVIQYYSAGYPDSFQPSEDGENASEQNEAGLNEGVCFIPVGTKTALGRDTHYAQMLGALRDANWKGSFSGDVRFLEDINAHWDRVPLKKRSGVVAAEGEGGRKRASDILVPTAILESVNVATKPTATGKTGSAAAKSAPAAAKGNQGSGSDLDAKLRDIVIANLPADGSAVKKGAFAGKVMSSKSLIPAEKSKGVPRVASNDFLNGGMNEDPALWLFDEEAGTVAALVE
jgi:hypothetical protein